MRVSVLLPTYNQAAFLERALDGLHAQTFRDFELIACDDGSTDATGEILRRRGIRTVTHGRNRGTATAINSAEAVSDPGSEFLTWASSDNLMHPTWLERLLAKAESPGVGAVYSAYERIEEADDGKTYRKTVGPGAYRKERLIASPACYFGPSFLIRRGVWQPHRGLSSHDWDNWARVEEACWRRGLTIGYVTEPLCDFYRGDWNTCARRPDLYDAPKWRELAQHRRALTRNWLGDLVAARIGPNDEVLDLGSGIMPATGGRLNCERHVGVDSFAPYLDFIGPPTVCGRLPEVADGFSDNSFDVVLLLDVIEHLDKPAAMTLLASAERIARREVIVFTPDGFVPQAGWRAWGMEENPDQAHLCGFAFDELVQLGYDCTRHRNGTAQAGPILSVFGTKCLTPH